MDDSGEPPDTGDLDLSALPTLDTLDAVLGRVVAMDVVAPPLAIGAELAGRYRIEELIGSGGMGTVYRAYDRQLERQVAIKLHRWAEGDDRLRREAVAMAQLAHPNVITVFEVGSVGGQTFVAMELIHGQTLRDWLAARPRSLHDRLGVLHDAGVGLAAAHAAGLVHRDFKPENVMIGDDGRARVGDFGLARSPTGSEPGSTRTHPVDLSSTRTGAILGTPTYMAPEQARGEAIDARADQLAFCIVAWETLAGKRPFTGTTIEDCLRSMEAGERQAAAKLPGRLRRALDRGLAARQQDRYPSMRELLARLRPRSAKAYRVIAAGLIAALGATAVIAWAAGGTPVESCDTAGDSLISPPDQLGSPDVASRMASVLGQWRGQLKRYAVSACRGRVDGTLSPQLARRADGCLLIAARTTARLLAVDGVQPSDIPSDVVQTWVLPDVAHCTDPAALLAMPDLPSDPIGLETHVAAMTSAKAAEFVISVVHDPARARALLGEAERSAAAGTPIVAARISLVRGQLAKAADRASEARQRFEEAYYQARAIDELEIVLAAIAELLYLANDTGDVATMAKWIPLGLADARRSEARAAIAVSNIYLAVAAITMHGEHPDQAAELAAHALALIGNQRSMLRVHALTLVAQAACVRGRYDDCFANHARAIELLRTLVGPTNSWLATTLGNVALDYSDAGRAREAVPLVHEALEIIESTRSPNAERARQINGLAAVLINSGLAEERGRARKLLEQARGLIDATGGDRNPDLVDVESNLAELYADDDRDYIRARTSLAHALRVAETIWGPDHPSVADVLFNIAHVALLQGELDPALVAARRCHAIRSRVAPGSLGHAAALVALAEVANARRDPEGARKFAREALAMPVLRDPNDLRAKAELVLARADALVRELAVTR